MKKWTLHLLIAILISPGNASAFELYRAGARSAALGNISATLTGPESLFNNQAGLNTEEKLSIILSSESRFMMKELTVLAAGVVIPSKAGTAGVSHILLKAGVYRNSRTTLTFSRKLGDRLSAAVAFDYHAEQFPEVDHPFSALTASTGLQVRFSEKCVAGLGVFNPGRVKLKRFRGRERIPTFIRGGISWQLKSYLTLFNELEYQSQRPLSLSTGLEITPYSRISFRAGLSTYPLNLSGGVGFRSGKMEIDLSFYYHGYLGFTPVAGFTFNL